MNDVDTCKLQDVLGMSGSSVEDMCKRINVLLQVEMIATYIIERYEFEFSSGESFDIDTLIRLLRAKYLKRNEV